MQIVACLGAAGLLCDAALLRLVIRRDPVPEQGFALEDEDACIARLLARAIMAGKG